MFLSGGSSSKEGLLKAWWVVETIYLGRSLHADMITEGWGRQSRVGGRKHILFGQMDCLEEKQTIHLQRQCGSWTPSVVFLLRALGSQEILLSKKWAKNQENNNILLETWPGIFLYLGAGWGQMAEWLTQQIPVPEERQCCKEKMKSETE